MVLPIVGVEQSIQGVRHDTGAKPGDRALYDDFRSKSTILGPTTAHPISSGSSTPLAESGPVVMDYPAGATAGALMKQGRQNRQAAGAQQQAQAQQQAARAQYDKAYGVCLEGAGTRSNRDHRQA